MDASKIIDREFAALRDWRGDRLRELRKLIHQVEPSIVEEWKWMGSPVWNCDGIVCVANAHNGWVRVTFPKGAQLADPQRVFNAELEGNARRAIKWLEGDAMNVAGLKELLRAAIALNRAKPAARKAGASSSVTAKSSAPKRAKLRQRAARRT